MRRARTTAALAAALALVAPAHARAAGDGAWLALGALGGGSVPDARLADYSWDVAPHGAWGAELRAGGGRYGAGLTLWRTATTQSTGLPDVAPPAVRATSLELSAEARLAQVLGVALLLEAGGGRLHLGWAPERVTTNALGAQPVTIDFAPVDAWVGGGGLALRRPLAGAWSVGLVVERSVFALDTAHRAGAAIVDQRESFGDWNLALALDRVWFHR